MTTTQKSLIELAPGDVIIDPQGSRHTVVSVVPEHGDADEWEDAYDGFRVFTDNEPAGRLIVPVGAPTTILFRIEGEQK